MHLTLKIGDLGQHLFGDKPTTLTSAALGESIPSTSWEAMTSLRTLQMNTNIHCWDSLLVVASTFI